MSSSVSGRRLTRQLILFFSLFPFTVTGGCAHDHQLVPRERTITADPACAVVQSRRMRRTRRRLRAGGPALVPR